MAQSGARDADRSPRISLRSIRATSIGLSSQHHRHLSMRLPCRLYRDFHVLPESREKLGQTSDRKIAGTVAHERGDMGVLDAQDLAGLGLCQATCCDQFVDLQSQAGLEQLLLRIRQSEIGKDVAAARFCPDSGLLAHLNSAFPYDAA